MTAQKNSILVLGAGSWGTGLAVLLARNGYPVHLWGHDAHAIESLRRDRCNQRYLPDTPFPENLTPISDLAAAANCSAFLIVVPSHAFRETLTHLKSRLRQDAIVAWATKGLEPGSGKLLGDVARDVLAGTSTRLAVASGPTFAVEIARGLPAALTVAAETEQTANAVAAWLRNDRLRVYTSTDMAGVQLGGAIKNVMAIAAGISDGLGFGANARAALITRGLAELTRLGVALGGRPETFMGLAGAGDLILTCTDNTSRNRRVGLALGQGRSLAQALQDIGQEAEGVATAKVLRNLARRLGVEMPITEQVYRVIYEHCPPQEAVEALFEREPKNETAPR